MDRGGGKRRGDTVSHRPLWPEPTDTRIQGALLQSPDTMTADKIADLRDKFRDA